MVALQKKNLKLALYLLLTISLGGILYFTMNVQTSLSPRVEASDPVYSNEVTNITEHVEGNKRVVTEHHENARIPFITVYKYPFIDEVTGAAVPPPQDFSGNDYYRVTSTIASEDSGDEVCAIALNTSCTGYATGATTGFNVCKAFHPTASEVTDTDGSGAVVYCNGNPQAAPCSSLSNTCLYCPTCIVGVACNEAIGGLYREMYVSCTASTAVGTDLCSAGLDDDDGSGDGIIDLTAAETTFDNTSIIVDGCEVAIDGAHTFTNVTVRRNGRITQSPTGSGTFNTTDITVTGHTEIAIGSSIDVNGKGVAGQFHVDPAISTTTPQAGARNTHAGTLSLDPTEVYGDYFDPVYPGSGGTKANGNGGGVLHLTLNTLELEGEISADSSNPSLCGGTTGAGGSVKINITGEMTGDGRITANALPCTNATSDGSGGRIAIFYTTAGGINTLDPIQEYTVQAVNEATNDGSPGTIYLEDAAQVGVLYATNQGRLIVDQSTFSHEKDGGGGGLDDDLHVVLPATVTLHTLEIDDSRVTMAPSGVATLNIDSISGAGLLDIRDGGELTYTDMTTLGLIKKLIIDATGSTVQVDATSLIDARGKGAIRNEQIDPDTSTTNAVAGSNSSHGGLGNDTDSLDAVYGDFWDPQWPGSGVNSSVNARGGGYIGITAETFTHNGEIRADGNNMSCNSPAPAGGSVKITTTGTYSGSGTIQANAGRCTNGGGSLSGAGRVAFYYTTAGSINATPPDQQFTLEAHAKLPSSNDGSAGTVYIEDAQAVTDGDYLTGQGILIIDNNVAVENVQGAPILGTVNVYELRINNAFATAETLNIANALTLTNGARLKPQAMVTLGPIRRLTINADNAAVSIDATSRLDAQGLGTVGTDQIDPDVDANNAIDGANTSHGGVAGTDASEAYGDFFNPIYPGSGGTNSASRAGGVIDLHANTLDLEGVITSTGRVHGGCGGSAASGGSVKIQIDSTYTGSGVIAADSGNCTNTSSTASGGRVAFFYTTAGSINATPPDQQYTLQAKVSDANGAPGTVYIEDANAVTLGTYSANQGRLIVRDTFASSATTGAPLLGTVNLYELTLDYGRVTAETLVVENSITLQNSSTLRHEAMASLGTIKRLNINSPNADLNIDATSFIDLNGLGARTNQKIDPSTSTTNAVSGSNRNHGGVYSTQYSSAYGDFRDPQWPGSGGNVGAAGGGVVIISVNNFDLDGQIRSNGADTGGCGGHPSSSGAIKITTTGELTGSGIIASVGGRCTNATTSTSGGGRVAFFYDSDPLGVVTNNAPNTLYNIDVTRGVTNGGPGTIYIEDDNASSGHTDGQGNLIINGDSASVFSTPLFTNETPTSLTLTDVTVINNADLILTSPCTGSLTINGTIDLSGGGSITDNTAGACTLATSALNITPAIMDAGINGIAYSDSVESAGGYAPKTYQCLDGLGGSVVTCDNANANLPNGLTMNSAGVVSGTPTATGVFNFVVRVTDSDPGGAQTDEETMQITIGSPPNTPTLVSPADGGTVNVLAPTLEANYSDADAGDTGTTDFRVSSGSSADCVNNVSIVASGTSAASTTNNEDLSFTVTPNLTDLTTYNWCARNDDGVAESNGGAFTAMGDFTVDLSFSPGGSSPQKQQAVEQTPSEDAPAEETPVEDTPTEEAPEEESPVEEAPTEQPTEPEVPVEQPEESQQEESPDLPQQEQDEAPGDGELPPPPEPPTQEESEQIDDLLDEVIDLEQQENGSGPAPELGPLETGINTNSQSDGRSFTIEVEDEVLEDDLIITGLATTEEDRIEFTGTTSEPNSTITLFFDNNVTVVVTSDETGFWQTFVSAEQLGVSPGEQATVQVEAIASKPGLQSSKVEIGQIALNYTDEQEVVADFETIISDNDIVTNIQAFTKEIVNLIQEQEVVIQTTLTAAAPLVVVSSAPLWGYIPYMPAMVYHFIVYLLGLLGRKKQKDEQLFGQVYDSITKKPLGLAVLRVYNQAINKLAATKVTDKYGRYDLLLEPGSYRIEVNKPQYTFPSKIVSSGPDGEHAVIYNHETGLISAEGSLTIPDIPVDPVNAKRKFALANIFKKFWMMFQRIGHILAIPVLFIGSLVSVASLVAVPESFANWVIAIIYILLLTLQLRLRTIAEKTWGVVYDLATSAALPLTTIQLIDPEYGKVVKSRLTDYEGRFAFLPEPGNYVVKATKPGYEQSEVIESPDKKHNPIDGELNITKEGQRIDGDVAMRQL